MSDHAVRCAIGGALLLMAAGGCASAQWVYRATGTAAQSVQQPSASAAPAAAAPTALTVQVTDASAPGAAGGEAASLSDGVAHALADALQAEGYAATVASASPGGGYALACTIQHAGVQHTRRFSDALSYVMSAECSLAQGAEALWSDVVTQRYDEHVFVNTMSKLPAGYEARWARECFLPWRRLVVWRTAHALRREHSAPPAQTP